MQSKPVAGGSSIDVNCMKSVHFVPSAVPLGSNKTPSPSCINVVAKPLALNVPNDSDVVLGKYID